MKNIKTNKLKIKTGDLVKVRSGKWKGLVDHVLIVKPKKSTVYLKQVSIKVFDKSLSKEARKEKIVKKELIIPLHISKVAKIKE